MNAAETRGGRYVLWGARARDVQIGGVVDRAHRDRYRLDGRVLLSKLTKRSKRLGW